MVFSRIKLVFFRFSFEKEKHGLYCACAIRVCCHLGHREEFGRDPEIKTFLQIMDLESKKVIFAFRDTIP